MFVDTHVHFDLLAEAGPEDVIRRAGESGVDWMLAVGGSGPGNAMAVKLAEQFPGRILSAAGFDREHAGRSIDFQAFEALARDKKVSAIGEVGLDYHYHPETAEAQKELLGRMLEVAQKLGLPAIIHTREADADTLELLGQWRGVRGVVHCFTGNTAFAMKVIELGFYISFSGIVTFRNAGQLREVVKMVPDDRLLVETDSPFLAPEPHRGKKNEPAFLKCVAEAVAKERGWSVEKGAELTSRNATTLFQGSSGNSFGCKSDV